MVPAFDSASRDVLLVAGFMPAFRRQVSLQVLTFSDPMEPPALLSADHVFSSETEFPLGRFFRNMSWNRGWSTSSWGSSSWVTRRDGTTVTGNREPIIRLEPRHLRNRRCRVEMFSIPSSFAPDWECYDSNSVSNKKFFSEYPIDTLVHKKWTGWEGHC